MKSPIKNKESNCDRRRKKTVCCMSLMKRLDVCLEEIYGQILEVTIVGGFNGYQKWPGNNSWTKLMIGRK